MVMDEQTKICAWCKIPKPLEEFKPRGENGRIAYCLECEPLYRKAWAAENRDRIRKRVAQWAKTNAERLKREKHTRYLRRKYDLTPEGYEEIQAAQGYKCAICRIEEPTVIDFNPETKEVRGLLCQACDRGLGYFRDNHVALANAAIYLTRESKLGNSILLPNLGV